MKIEKKKLVWPWFLAIGLLALLIYWLGFHNQQKEAQESQPTVDLINVNENNLIVAGFVNFIEKDTMKMELDPTFTKEALLKLVDATNAMAEEIHFDIRANMDRVVLSVNKTVAGSIESTRADDFKQAIQILTSTILKSMQQAKYPGLMNEIIKIENAVATIKPDELIVNQKEAVKIYFKSTAELLQKMN